MKMIFRKSSLLAVLLLGVFIFVGCSGGAKPQPPKKRDAINLIARGSEVKVIRADDWAAQHPDVFASYMKNHENDQHYQYPQAYPYLQQLYKGMAFSFDYNSARGHVFAVEDVYTSTRPRNSVGCFSCKSPEVHAQVAEHGLDFLANTTFDQYRPQVTEPKVSCFNCHANEPGKMTVVASFIPDFLSAADIAAADPIDLTCAQCHIEYHWDAATRRQITPSWNSIESMHPDKMLEYFNGLKMPDGTLYFDFINPDNQIRQIKIQHPEFETLYSTGSVHGGPKATQKQFNCADCHMGTDRNAAGKPFTNHFWRSPLNVQNPSCVECHKDLAADVKRIQGPIQDKTKAIGNDLAALMAEINTKIQSGRYDEAKMNEVRLLFRNAQFYWDYVFVENSNGAHNSRLSHYCLDKARDIYNQARAVFSTI